MLFQIAFWFVLEVNSEIGTMIARMAVTPMGHGNEGDSCGNDGDKECKKILCLECERSGVLSKKKTCQRISWPTVRSCLTEGEACGNLLWNTGTCAPGLHCVSNGWFNQWYESMNFIFFFASLKNSKNMNFIFCKLKNLKKYEFHFLQA